MDEQQVHSIFCIICLVMDFTRGMSFLAGFNSEECLCIIIMKLMFFIVKTLHVEQVKTQYRRC